MGRTATKEKHMSKVKQSKKTDGERIMMRIAAKDFGDAPSLEDFRTSNWAKPYRRDAAAIDRLAWTAWERGACALAKANLGKRPCEPNPYFRSKAK